MEFLGPTNLSDIPMLCRKDPEIILLLSCQTEVKCICDAHALICSDTSYRQISGVLLSPGSSVQ